ncbi:MAG: hypothetical protein ACI9OD_003735 [Limisphaerales bacterium]|jgi:hypothetical protein
MNPLDSLNQLTSRRAFLGKAGLGSIALASLLKPGVIGAAPGVDRWTGVLDQLHHTPKIKRIIHLYMAGGPTHLETFDFKSELRKMDGKPMPESFTKGQPIAQLQNKELKCLGPQHDFQEYGQSGQHFSKIMPHLGTVADDLAIVRSMRTDAINHDPAHTLMNTGTLISGRPSIGSWMLYGLGAETNELPGYVVLSSIGKHGQSQPISARQWHSGFLPSRFQGVELRSVGDPVLYVGRPAGVTHGRQRDVVDTINRLNLLHERASMDPEIRTRIAQYEMAFRMQTSVPDLVDLNNEPESVKEMYGTKGADGSFAANCLLARRLAERGVRFIQLYHRGWDHHGSVKSKVAGTAAEIDQASAALIKDLKQRGMFDDSLIIWGGEFGRTPMAQGSGRDHHIKGFSMWFAGGGIKGGTSYGSTDELGYNAVDNIMHVNDLQATILHLLGIDHKRLSFKFQGLDMRLTGIAGNVVNGILS